MRKKLFLILGILSYLIFPHQLIAKSQKLSNKSIVVPSNDEITEENIIEKNYSKAISLYDKKFYSQAIKYFDEVVPLMVLDKRIKDARLMQAYCSFYIEDYVASSYQFEELYNDFKNDFIAEEALYMYGSSFYELAWNSFTDKEYIQESIFIFKNYLSIYPEGKFIAQVQKYLLNVLEKNYLKIYNIAKTYYLLEYFNAAKIELNRILDNPPSKETEINSKWLMLKVLYYDAYYAKKDWSKWLEAQQYCLDFIFDYSESKYLKKADKILKKIQKTINK